MNQISKNSGEDVALFIDWENFKISLAAGSRLPNVSALKEEASNYGRIVVAKAYADWVTRNPELRGASQFSNDPPPLYAAGIEPVYVPTSLPWDASAQNAHRRIRVKNSVDVKMTTDCIEYAHSYPNISTFILVSGDSDFIHVINALRTMGKRVIIIGVSWATSRRLADQVDGLILYDVDVDPITPPEPVPATHVHNGRPVRDAGVGRKDLPQIIEAIEEIVRTERQAGGTPLLTMIKQRLMRRFSGFDEKKLGFATFKKLMQRAAQEGNIKLTTRGLVDWAIMADEPAPSEAAPEPVPSVPVSVAPEELLHTAGRPKTRAKGPPSEPQAEPQVKAFLEEDGGTPDLAVMSSLASPPLELSGKIGDGLDDLRIADLIIMANTLEGREGTSHVAFNFLVKEMCKALDEGLKADHEEITQRWGQISLRPYVTKTVRDLMKEKILLQGWHTWKDPNTSRSRRRRATYLNRDHQLAKQTLEGRWKPEPPKPPEVPASEFQIESTPDEPEALLESTVPSAGI